jgi:flagellar biogenesis protein FliO
LAKAATTGSRTTRPRRAAKKAVMVTDTVARQTVAADAAAPATSVAALRFAAAVAATTAYAETSPPPAEAAPLSEPAEPAAPAAPAPSATPIFGRRGTGLASRRSTAAAIRVTPDSASVPPASPPAASAASAGTPTRSTPPRTFAARWLSAIDALPPIKLPIGPAIPWRFGLPAVVALVVCMALLSRPTAHAEGGSTFRLPAESETYAVTQDAPLFANSQADKTPPAQPIGVAEPPALGVDVLDLTLKLVAVLALAYGSLTLLKRARVGGGSTAASGGSLEGLRIISTLSLAPNRSVHVVRAPGGKTLLLGATPGQVNLIADLGQVSDAELTGATSASTFFDVLASKLNPSS